MKTANTAKTKKAAETDTFPAADRQTMDDLIQIFKSLADQHRLRILFILAKNGEMHVSAICEQLGQSQPAVSHHLTQLKSAKLVEFRRDGKYNYYKLDSSRVAGLIEHFFPGSSSAQQKLTFGDLELTFKKK